MGRWAKVAAAVAVAASVLVPLSGLASGPARPSPVPPLDQACPGEVVPTGTFSDLGGGSHDRAIDCLAWWGIASGRADGTFGPAAAVSRGQLATLLATLVEATGGRFAAEPANPFVDVDGSGHELGIAQLAAAGIVRGHGPTRYVPSRSATRGQAATLVARTLEHRLRRSLPAAPDRFADVADPAQADDVAALAGLGVVTGTTASRFRPDAHLTRGQMASLLTRTLAVLVDGGHVQPPAHPGSSPQRLIGTGISHTCQLRPDTTVWCWGLGRSGRLGDDGTASRARPVQVVGLTGVTSVAVGGHHSCALLSGGAVRCWGSNSEGALGDGTRVHRPTPVPVRGLAGVVAIDAHLHHTCAVTAVGAVHCWGRNTLGQLGDGTRERRLSPTPVQGVAGAVGVAAARSHTCAHLRTGTVLCWGDGSQGTLVEGVAARVLDGPRTVPGLTEVVELTGAADDATCARRRDGTVWCWGRNGDGELGDGTTVARAAPAPVPGVSSAVRVSQRCVVLADTSMACWLRRFSGNPMRVVPGPVPWFTGVVDVSVRWGHGCVVLADASAACWGNGRSGQLGHGRNQGSRVPVPVAP
jgi:alpha-tubulin suppressor-like RCC1 family protein